MLRGASPEQVEQKYAALIGRMGVQDKDLGQAIVHKIVEKADAAIDDVIAKAQAAAEAQGMAFNAIAYKLGLLQNIWAQQAKLNYRYSQMIQRMQMSPNGSYFPGV